MTAPLLRRAAAVVTGAATALVTGVFLGAPAQALTTAVNTAVTAGMNVDDGQQTGGGLSPLQTLLIYVGIPALLFVVIVLLVSAPSVARGPRYRPGLGWWAAPVWFNGPEDADAAVRTATATTGGGGASARW